MTSYNPSPVQPPSPIHYRRWVLFMDGATRAAILPFGPILLGRLLYGGGHLQRVFSYSIHESTSLDSNSISSGGVGEGIGGIHFFWDSIAWYTATLVSAYMLGHGIGALVGHLSVWAQQRMSPEGPSSWFYRIVGIIVALHVFSFGTTVQSHGTLVALRFMSGLLMGAIHRTTSLRVASKLQMQSRGTYKETPFFEVSPTHQQNHPVTSAATTPGGPLYCLLDEEEPEVCKHWLAGFAISMIVSGIIYQDPLQPSGFYSSLLSPRESNSLLSLFLFMIISAIAEIAIRRGMIHWIACFTSLYSLLRRLLPLQNISPFHERKIFCQRKLASYSQSAAVGSIPVLEGILRRRRGTEDNGPFGSPTNYSKSRDRLDSNTSRGTRRSRINSNMSIDGNRSRMNSNMSNDFFYDCSSEYPPDDQYLDDFLEENHFSSHIDSIAKYSNGKCTYDDESPSPVPPGTSRQIIPRSYVEFFGKSKAEKKWTESQRWRIEENVWRIHRLPHRWFPKIKTAYPHFVHGYTKAGYPVVYEKPGEMTLKELFAEGLEVSDMLRHYIFFMEFISNVLCHRSEVRNLLDQRSEKDSASSWGFFVVMDVTGASLSTVMSGNVLKYLKLAGDTNTNHYPASMKRCILVNAPFWLSGVFSSMKYIVPESVQVDIHSASSRLNGLRQFIEDDQIPKEYGGSSTYALGEHPFEVELSRLVDTANLQSENETAIEIPSNTPNTLGTVRHRSPSPTKRSVEIRWAPDDVTDIETGVADEVDDLFDNPEASKQRRKPLVTGLHGCETSSVPPPYIKLGLKSNHDRFKSTIFADESVVVIVSIMHGVWCAIQGSLETALPLWLLSPTLIGGLGYEPVRAGVVCFVAALVLILMSRTRVSRNVSRIPAYTPLRGYRMGVGAEAFLLALFALVPSASS